MVHFECDTCGVRVSREVSLLEDEGRLCDDG